MTSESTYALLAASAYDDIRALPNRNRPLSARDGKG